VADHHRTAARHVVDSGGHAGIEQQPVGLDDVVDVEKIPYRLEVADAQQRLPETRGDLTDLSREARGHEGVGLPGAGVIEGPHAHDVEALPRELAAQQLGRGLAEPVG